MKILKLLGLSGTLIGILLISTTSFYSCEPDDDCSPDSTDLVKKPNIYIYPKEKIQLEVKLGFPLGGEVVKSIPKYGKGWNVTVDKGGLINDTYSYLFYESRQLDVWQQNEGWIVNREGLSKFFEENMLAYGFYGAEIRDFIDYWIPLLKDYTYYAVYPQNSKLIEKVIMLNLSKKPDNLLRLFYEIKGLNNVLGIELNKPQIEPFKRDGYFIVEWGGVLK